MEQGRSASFRRATRLERLASRFGSLLPSGARPTLARLYGRALGILQPERLVAVLPGGERIRVLPEYRQLTWNPEEYQAFAADLRPGDTALDIGANLGAYTLLFAQRVGAGGRVVAFEPAPEPLAGLRSLVRANLFDDRVTVVSAAVAEHEGRASFLANGSDGANRLSTGASGGLLAVDTTTVDAVCRRMGLRPRLMKIDAEGAELQVLRGARDTIRAGGADLRVYVEMHPHLWDDFGASRQAIEAELSLQRLRAERLDGRPDIWGIEGVCLRLTTCAS